MGEKLRTPNNFVDDRIRSRESGLPPRLQELNDQKRNRKLLLEVTYQAQDEGDRDQDIGNTRREEPHEGGVMQLGFVRECFDDADHH